MLFSRLIAHTGWYSGNIARENFLITNHSWVNVVDVFKCSLVQFLQIFAYLSLMTTTEKILKKESGNTIRAPCIYKLNKTYDRASIVRHPVLVGDIWRRIITRVAALLARHSRYRVFIKILCVFFSRKS